MKAKICQICHKEYIPRSGRQKYCSQECAKKAKRECDRKYYLKYRPKITSVCPTCHKEFILRHGNQKYCCSECKKIAKLVNQKQYQQEHKDRLKEYRREHPRVLKLCPHKRDCFNCPEEDCIVQ